jgi:hypothetical protein
VQNGGSRFDSEFASVFVNSGKQQLLATLAKSLFKTPNIPLQMPIGETSPVTPIDHNISHPLKVLDFASKL